MQEVHQHLMQPLLQAKTNLAAGNYLLQQMMNVKQHCTSQEELLLKFIPRKTQNKYHWKREYKVRYWGRNTKTSHIRNSIYHPANQSLSLMILRQQLMVLTEKGPVEKTAETANTHTIMMLRSQLPKCTSQTLYYFSHLLQLPWKNVFHPKHIWDLH